MPAAIPVPQRSAVPMSRGLWVFIAATSICALTLARTERYFGRIYHGWDAQFYYSVAHALLFNGALDPTDSLTSTPYPAPFDPDGDGSWRAAPRRADGRIPSKYPVGLSLVQIPALGAGRLVRFAATSTGWKVSDAAGYSALELWTVALGLQLIFCVGLVVLYRLLADAYGRPAALLGTLGCWLGTSLFYYSAVFPFMAHAVSFALLVFILRATRTLAHHGASNARLAGLGFLIAALFLVRPQQSLVALFLLPLVVRSLRGRPTSTWRFGAIAAASIGVTAAALQTVFIHAQFGAPLLSGYMAGDEGFSFPPDLSLVCFSATSGLLAFSPIVLIAAVGYLFYARSISSFAWPMLANALAQLLIIASWSSPEQGDAFGARMWSDNSAVVAIGLAVLYRHSRPTARPLVVVAALAAAGWTIYLLGRYVGAFS